MDNGLLEFWETLRGKVVQTIKDESKNCIRRGRFEVVTAPNGSTMGVKQPFGRTINLPYAPTVIGAEAGDSVFVEWSGTLSSGYVYSFGDGVSRAGTLTATVGTMWTASGNLYTQTIQVQGMKSTIVPTAHLLLSGTADEGEITAWGHIKHIAGGTNSITVYADAQTVTAIDIILKIF